MNPICSLCKNPVYPHEERVSTFAKDPMGFTTERGAIHVACLERAFDKALRSF